MGTPLWTAWDTVTLVVYEAMAVSIAVFVPGDWQLPVFVLTLPALVLVGRWFLHHTERGARILATVPRRRSAPIWLIIAAMVVVLVPVQLALGALFGQSDGWMMVAFGAWLPALRITDGWWAARTSLPA